MKKMRIAIVTGASSGMGREIVRLLAKREEVDQILLIARREDRLRDVAAEVMCHVKTEILPLDLADPSAASAVAAVLSKEKKRVTWLVNAAGFGHIGCFDELTLKEQTDMLDVNCRALTAMTYTVLPFMRKGAHVVNLASAAAFLPQPRFAVYAASKSYVLSFSRAIGRELRGRGISVTAVCPGPVETEFFDIAERTGEVKFYKKLMMANCEKVSRGIVRASAKGKSVYVPTLAMKTMRVGAKLPHGLLIRFFG